MALTQPQRAALILLDGRHTVAEVLAATASIGVTNDDIELLVSSGLLHRAAAKPATVARATAPQRASAGSHADEPSRTSQQRYRDAYPIAARLTASLGLRGFLLNLAVEGALDVGQLRALSPRIREAVGSKAFAELDRALNG